MLGYILLVSLAGTVFATQIFFDSPTPTEPYQVTKFFTIQYVTTTVALSPQTVTETINPTCTITASSIPVCGEASVGIIFTSGGSISPTYSPEVTTIEDVAITTATDTLLTGQAQRTATDTLLTGQAQRTSTDTPLTGEAQITATDSLLAGEAQRTATDTLLTDEAQRADDEDITTPGTVDIDEINMKEEDSMTTTVALSRLDLTENEINEYDYSEVETTTFIGLKEKPISNAIPDDKVSTISNKDMNIKNDKEIISVTNIDNTDEEVMSIISAINSIPQISVVPIEATQTCIQTSDNTRLATESYSSQMPLSTSQQQGLPLSTSYEMATVVLPSCECASGRQPRGGIEADIITFMTTKTVDVATVTETGISMHTIQYAGCVPEDAVVTNSCV